MESCSRATAGPSTMKCEKQTVKNVQVFPRFSVEEDEELIFEVSCREVLYKLSDGDYKNVLKKDNEWQEVGVILGKPGDLCKKRWKNIRDNYTRHRREDCFGTGKAAKRKRAHYWEMLSFLNSVEDERKELTNVDAELEEAEATQDLSRATDASDDINIDSDTLQFDETEQRPPTTTPPTKISYDTENVPKKPSKTRTSSNVLAGLSKERLEGHQQLIDCVSKFAPPASVTPHPENDVDLFFKTMAATVKKFSPQQIAQVKGQIFNIVNQIEINNLSYGTPSFISSNTSEHSFTSSNPNSRPPSDFSGQQASSNNPTSSNEKGHEQ